MHVAPEVREVPVAQLTVDHTVQRALDKLRVEKMANDYKPDAVGVVVVSERPDGTMHVIDGQHRVAATNAAGFGDRSLQCLIYTGLDRPAEAAMFRRLNTTRAVQAIDKFRVRVIEGDPIAVQINDVLVKHGWNVSYSKNDGQFAAVAAIEAIYRGTGRGQVGDNVAACDTTISVVTEAWGHDADGVRAEVISGVGAVVLRHGARLDLAKLINELSSYSGGPRALTGKAKSLRDIRGGRIADGFAEIVINLVNKSRRSNRLPDWHSSAA
jgi:hypothetical protein